MLTEAVKVKPRILSERLVHKREQIQCHSPLAVICAKGFFGIRLCGYKSKTVILVAFRYRIMLSVVLKQDFRIAVFFYQAHQLLPC